MDKIRLNQRLNLTRLPQTNPNKAGTLGPLGELTSWVKLSSLVETRMMQKQKRKNQNFVFFISS